LRIIRKGSPQRAFSFCSPLVVRSNMAADETMEAI
jgi:hypothetical protein